MNIKIECSCGTRYSFDVEPVNGRMPFAVQCPNCHVDGTPAANEVLGQTAGPAPTVRLRVHAAEEGQTAAAPLPIPPALPRVNLAEFKAQKQEAEERAYRKGVRLLVAGLGVAVVCIGAWAVYSLYASKPHVAGEVKLSGGGAASVRFIGPDRVLVATPTEATLRDVSLEKVIWNTALSSSASAFRAPIVFPDKDRIWFCMEDQLKCLDAASGSVKQTIPISGHFVSFTPSEASLLVVSEPDETRRIAMHIERSSGAVTSQEIVVPRREKQAMPNDLPANVLPTAAVLTAQILEEQKFNKPLDAMSSEFFSTGKSLLEMRVKLLAAKIDYVQSIKPKGPSHLNGQTTASTSAGVVAEEVFNDIKRSQTGGVRALDNSRYDVRLRRWIEQEPVEWQGEVVGQPAFFALTTVDLLTAGPNLIVFDKQNKKLFESKLSYPVSGRFIEGEMADHPAPAAEGSNTLYFFDEGVLTAFALPSGDVRWRLPSFGISAIHTDDKGMLYVDSTEAGPEDVKYADTISLEKIPPVLLKVDPSNGKILWKAEGRGDRSFISGKFVYSESVEQGGVALALALGDALAQPRGEGPVYFHFYRLDPDTGETMWSLYREARPHNVAVERNRILLRFGDELQIFKFMSF